MFVQVVCLVDSNPPVIWSLRLSIAIASDSNLRLPNKGRRKMSVELEKTNQDMSNLLLDRNKFSLYWL